LNLLLGFLHRGLKLILLLGNEHRFVRIMLDIFKKQEFLLAHGAGRWELWQLGFRFLGNLHGRTGSPRVTGFRGDRGQGFWQRTSNRFFLAHWSGTGGDLMRGMAKPECDSNQQRACTGEGPHPCRTSEPPLPMRRQICEHPCFYPRARLYVSIPLERLLEQIVQSVFIFIFILIL